MPRTLLSNVNLTATHVLRVDHQPALEQNKDEMLDKRVNQLFDLETLGISEANSVHESFLQNIKFDNSQYSVKLPWREHNQILPDNFELSVNRLVSTVKCLHKTPELLEEYNKVIQDQLEQGIMEKIKPNIEHVEPGNVHYLSHHAVVRKELLLPSYVLLWMPVQRFLQIRLHTGSSLTPKILDILVQFRSYKVAIVSDIMKAFHMINVEERDRNVLRFLWLSDLESDNPELLVLRFCKLVFGLNYAPFILGATLQHHISNYEFEDPSVIEKLLESFYVDDFLSGSSNEEQAKELFLQAKKCLTGGGFTLRKWKTSSPELREFISECDQSVEERPGPSTPSEE